MNFDSRQIISKEQAKPYQEFLKILDSLRADVEAVDLLDLVAHVQRALAMYHATDEYARNETPALLAHLERDAHGLLGVLLKLD